MFWQNAEIETGWGEEERGGVMKFSVAHSIAFANQTKLFSKERFVKKDVRNSLITAGVKNLKEYGYPEVSPENILSDKIYSSFFKSMLYDNLGQGFDTQIKALLTE